MQGRSVWAVVVIGVAAVSALARGGFLGVTDASIERDIAKECEKINSQDLSRYSNNIVRLDGVMPGEGKEVVYYYTITGFDSGEINSSMRAEVERRIRDEAARLPEMDAFRRHGVDITYSYQSADGVEILDVTLDH